MKVLLGLMVILCGALITSTSSATESTKVRGNVEMVPSAVPYAENAPGVTKPCKYLQGLNDALKGKQLNAKNNAPGSSTK